MDIPSAFSALPRSFKAALPDRILDIVQNSHLGEFTIQAELHFDQQLDEQALTRAMQLTMLAHPVLCSQFIPRYIFSFWKTIPYEQLVFIQKLKNEQQLDAFRNKSVQEHHPQSLNIALLQTEKSCTLLVVLHHSAGDTGALKDIMYTLARYYTHPQSFIKTTVDPKKRSLKQLYRSFPWWIHLKIIVSYIMQILTFTIPFRNTVSSLPKSHQKTRSFVVHRFSKQDVSQLRHYAKKHGATLNDLFVAAFFHAQKKYYQTSPGRRYRLQTTIDLRKWYIPSNQGEDICNLSSYEYPQVTPQQVSSFEETLHHVSLYYKRRLKNLHGLTDIKGMSMVGLFPNIIMYKFLQTIAAPLKRFHLWPNIITNLGPVEKQRCNFNCYPIDIIIHPPSLYPPVLGLGLSGYDGTLHISSGTSVDSQQALQDFIDLLIAQLPL